MNKKIKYILICMIFVLISFVFTTAKSPGNDENAILRENSEISPEYTPKISSAPEHALAETKSKSESDNVTKYILKYDGKSIILITVSPNGSQSSHSIDNINPQYLTQYDLNQLREGIVTKSESELYKLIEDFSS